MSEFDIAESDILDGLDLTQNGRLGLKELYCLVYRHIEDVRNCLTFPPHLEGLPVIARTSTYFAGYVHVRHKMHLDGLVTVTEALLAASAFGVEREPTGFPAAYLGFRQGSKQFAYIVEHIGIGGRMGD